MTTRSLVLFAVAAWLASSLPGCLVKKSVYEKAIEDLDAAMQESRACAGTVEERDKEIAALKRDLDYHCQLVKDKEGELAGLQRQLKAANEELARLAKVTNEEAEAANQERARLQAIIESLNSNLDETQRAVEEMRKRAAQQEARLQTFQGLLDRFRQLIDAGQLDVRVVRGRMVVQLSSGILFDSGKVDIKPEGRRVLDEVATVLQSIPDRNYQIEGHTDNVPIVASSRYPSNWELSTARATEVVKYLVSKGLEPERLSAAGFAEFTPVAPNDTPENRAKNRRIEIVVLPNLDEMPSFDTLEKVANEQE